MNRRPARILPSSVLRPPLLPALLALLLLSAPRVLSAGPAPAIPEPGQVLAMGSSAPAAPGQRQALATGSPAPAAPRESPAPLAGSTPAAPGQREALPPPITDPHSTEICLNSRISYHGGWSGSSTNQALGDILDAAAHAPVTSGSRAIYAATSAAVYLYNPEGHSLTVHKSGDFRSDATAAFEVGVAAGNMFDAGAAMHLAQLESVALWTGTAGPRPGPTATGT
jgi:hypothetical protein